MCMASVKLVRNKRTDDFTRRYTIKEKCGRERETGINSGTKITCTDVKLDYLTLGTERNYVLVSFTKQRAPSERY